jgi:pimeloyl-ACP methyl ester carboxylesterase
MLPAISPLGPNFLQAGNGRYAYRRFGAGTRLRLLCLQHFTGTLDNWDPAVTDPLATERELILFENDGVGRSSGTVPKTIAGMAAHALAFLDGLGPKTCDVLGFSLGGMVAQQMTLERPSIFRRMILVGTAPRGGEDIMHLEEPSLAKYLRDPTLQGYAVLQKLVRRKARRPKHPPARPSARGWNHLGAGLPLGGQAAGACQAAPATPRKIGAREKPRPRRRKGRGLSGRG